MQENPFTSATGERKYKMSFDDHVERGTSSVIAGGDLIQKNRGGSQIVDGTVILVQRSF